LLPLDRTLDLSSLGIDFSAIFDRLLSPKGIVQQFALTLVLSVFRSVGWATFGLGYGALVDRASPGPLLDLLGFFEVVLTPQAIATSMVRDLLRIVWELAGRVVTTTLLFGVFESFSQVVANTTVEGLWSFLSSSSLKQLMSLRSAFTFVFFFSGFFLLSQLGMVLNPSTARHGFGAVGLDFGKVLLEVL